MSDPPTWWLTGLPGAGKTTLAQALQQVLPLIYQFLRKPLFEHDFEQVQYDAPEFNGALQNYLAAPTYSSSTAYCRSGKTKATATPAS